MVKEIDNGVVIDGSQTDKDSVIDAIKKRMKNEGPVGEEVKVMRRLTKKPMIRMGNEEVVVKELDNGDIKVTWAFVSDELIGEIRLAITNITNLDSPRNRERNPTEGFKSERTEQPESTNRDRVDSNGTSGMGQVWKPYSKEQAEYKTPEDSTFEQDHKRCRECSHWDENGNCHIVGGEIEAEAYCENFFADVGMYGHRHGDVVELNLVVWGDGFDWTANHSENFLTKQAEKLEERI